VTCDSGDLRRRHRREYLISPRSSQRKVNRWFGHNPQQNRAKSSIWKYMPVSFLLKIHSSRSNSRSRRLRVVVRDIVVTAQHQTVQIEPSKATSFRLSTEGLVLRKSPASMNAFRCFFAEGEIGGTPCMRSHILVQRATTKYFSISFICKNKIEKEGLPKDSPAGLGAGGPEFKSRRPDQNISRVFCSFWKANFT
jgi:hypothetical protein